MDEETKKREEQIMEKVCNAVLKDEKVLKYANSPDYFYNYDPAYHARKVLAHLLEDRWFISEVPLHLTCPMHKEVDRESGERRSSQVPYHLRKILKYMDRKIRFNYLFGRQKRGEKSEIEVLLDSPSLDIWFPCTSLRQDEILIRPYETP